MRPARAAAAKNTPAKPGRQPSFSQSAIALATATSHWALSKSSDSPMVPARARQGHPVTPPRDARKEGSQMRPARAAAAKNTPAKPGRQPSFSQSDQTMMPAARRLPVVDENDEFAEHSTQSLLQSRSDPSSALATATSHRALSKSSDSPMVPARTRQGHPVTPPRDARKEGSQMRPARAAAAKNTPAKPGRQPSFSQSTAISHREGSQMRPARAAAENKNITGSSSAPKKKLSSGALFLAEMVRRRMVSETGEPNVT